MALDQKRTGNFAQSRPLTTSTLTQLNSKKLKPPGSKCRVCFRKFFAFLVSNVGLCVLVVAYSIGGAFMFRAIESPFEVQTTNQVNELRNRTIINLWNISKYSITVVEGRKILLIIAYNNNVLYYDKWKLSIAEEIKVFQRELLKAIKDGYEGRHREGQEQWSFSGAFLFSLTVISTIGNNNNNNFQKKKT